MEKNKMKDYKMTESECEENVGHKWQSTGIVLTSIPPQYFEVCSVCGKQRTRHPQEPMRYTY
jgi:hypothetical protein